MSGDAGELPGSASSWTERGKARRFLLGIPVFWLGMALFTLGERVHVAGPLGLTFVTLPLALALIIGSLILARSRPQGYEKPLIPRTLRRIARLADVPELSTMIMVYGCIVVVMSIQILSLVALYQTP
jgi:hypothetical protein